MRRGRAVMGDRKAVDIGGQQSTCLARHPGRADLLQLGGIRDGLVAMLNVEFGGVITHPSQHSDGMVGIGLQRLVVEVDGVILAVGQPTTAHATVGAGHDDRGVPRLVRVADRDRRPALAIECQRVVCPQHGGSRAI